MMLPETTLKTRSDQIKTLCKKLRKIKVRSTLANMFLQDSKAENILVSFIAPAWYDEILTNLHLFEPITEQQTSHWLKEV